MLAVCGLVWRKGRFLMCKRASCMQFPGFWELPTEILEDGETAEDALERAFFDRLTVNLRSAKPLGAVDFCFGEGGRIMGYGVELQRNFFHIYGYDDFCWVKPKNLKRLRVLPPYVTILTGINGSL